MRHRMYSLVVCLAVTATATLTGCSSPTSTDGACGDRAVISTTRIIETPTRRLGADLYVLHGLLSDAEAMQPLADYVSSLQLYRRVILCGYDDGQSVTTLGRGLTEYVRQNSQQRCDFVGHSLGGLVIRWAVEKAGLSNLTNRVWMLGTPHLGSKLDIWPVGGALADLEPGSVTLTELNSGPRLLNCEYRYNTIAGNLKVGGLLTQTDGVVPVSVANWSGLGSRAKSLTRATVNCSHSGLKSDPAALNQLAAMMRVQAAAN